MGTESVLFSGVSKKAPTPQCTRPLCSPLIELRKLEHLSGYLAIAVSDFLNEWIWTRPDSASAAISPAEVRRESF